MQDRLPQLRPVTPPSVTGSAMRPVLIVATGLAFAFVSVAKWANTLSEPQYLPSWLATCRDPGSNPGRGMSCRSVGLMAGML